LPLKENGTRCQISEQIIDDPVSGLTFQFEVLPNGESRLHVYGEVLKYGNRTIMFDVDGKEAGSGTSLTGLCKPSWVQEVDGL